MTQQRLVCILMCHRYFFLFVDSGVYFEKSRRPLLQHRRWQLPHGVVSARGLPNGATKGWLSDGACCWDERQRLGKCGQKDAQPADLWDVWDEESSKKLPIEPDRSVSWQRSIIPTLLMPKFCMHCFKCIHSCTDYHWLYCRDEFPWTQSTAYPYASWLVVLRFYVCLIRKSLSDDQPQVALLKRVETCKRISTRTSWAAFAWTCWRSPAQSCQVLLCSLVQQVVEEKVAGKPYFLICLVLKIVASCKLYLKSTHWKKGQENSNFTFQCGMTDLEDL